ncbi:MAG: FAD binding domain-containing protein [Chloroflexi bacterium]|nr:FAD binding domain-containing protein [Chloroflexota bacterium]
MLRLPAFTMERPGTYAEAATLLRAHGAARGDLTRGTPSLPVMLVAGGTDLFPNMKRRQFTPRVLISLGGVADATGIARDKSGLRIQAGTTLTTVASDAQVRERYTALAEAAVLVSTPQLRNMGTIGGNICLDTRCNWYDQSAFWRGAEGFCMKTHPEVVCRVAPSSPRCLAVASADTVPALLALGASVAIQSADGTRTVALADLHQEDGIAHTKIARDEIVVSVTLPDATGWRSTYLKQRDRGSFDFPIVGLAVAVKRDGARVTDARVALTAVASRPQLVADAAKALIGGSLDEAAIAAAADAVHKAARPMDNTSGTISQRKRTARVFAERALRALAA